MLKSSLVSVAALALASSTALAQAPSSEPAKEIGYEEGALGYAALMQGDYRQAIAQIEAAAPPKDAEVPADPAQLINLGLAHAKIGQREKAKEYYEAAIASRESFDLVLADGRVMDSRVAARRALNRLEAKPEAE